MSDTLLTALALMLVLEGLLPFFNPVRWRKVFEQMLRFSDGQLRFMGLISMAIGVVLLMVLT